MAAPDASSNSALLAIGRGLSLSAWFGLLIGLSEFITLVLAASILQMKSAPLGIDVSIFGWLYNQKKNIYLEVLSLELAGLCIGVGLAVLMLPALLLSGKSDAREERLERLFYALFIFAFLLVLVLVLTLWSLVVIRFDPGRSWPFVAAVCGGSLAFAVLVSYLSFYLLSKNPRPGTYWIQASFIIGACAFLASLGRGLAILPGESRLFPGALLAGLVVACVPIFYWLMMKALSRSRVRPLFRWFATGISIAAAALLAIGFSGVYRPPGVTEPQPGKPNFILIVLDTVRADRLSLFGHHRNTSPVLEELAREGVLFTRAFATAPWTIPSHASFFTGLHPGRHLCTHERLWLDKDHLTLAEWLRARGYVTLGYSNNPLVGKLSMMDQGFNRFVEGWRMDQSMFMAAGAVQLLYPGLFPSDHGAQSTRATIKRWLSDLAESGSPFFMFINYMEAHPPLPRMKQAFAFFESEDDARERLARIKGDFNARYAGVANMDRDMTEAISALYDGEVRYMDAEVGKILDALESNGLSESTAVMVISDHGEMMGEHGTWGHVRTLYHELLWVPVVIRYPGGLPAGERVTEPMSLRELPAMVMALENGGGYEGLVRAAATGAREYGGLIAEVERPVNFINLVKSRYPGKDTSPLDRRQKALIAFPWKAIWDSKGGDALYNLETDPKESKNMMSSRFDTYRELAARIERYREGLVKKQPAPLPPMDRETREKLKALGYLP